MKNKNKKSVDVSGTVGRIYHASLYTIAMLV